MTHMPVDIKVMLERLYDEGQAEVWWRTGNFFLDGKAPIDLVENGKDDEVRGFLHKVLNNLAA